MILKTINIMHLKSFSLLRMPKTFTFILSVFLVFFNNAPLLSQLVLNEEKIEKSIQINTYLLGPGDVINLNFLNNPELNTQVVVSPDGSITLPLVGSIIVNDLSLDKAKILIQEKLSQNLIVPEVQITIVDYKSIRVSLIGEVQKPGIYVLNTQMEKCSKTTAL